jgi:transcriptional regulator with XRE-family HTH domain
MFRTFAKVPNVGAQKLFLFHPTDLIAVLELAWDRRAEATALVLGHPLHRSDLNRFENTWFGQRALTPPAPGPVPARPLQPNLNPLIDSIVKREVNHVLWDHLIYAYMIENTRILEIFRRVVHELTHGEKLGAPSVETLHWLRNTEELFFRTAPSFFVTALHSSARTDDEATRRAAYHRVVGMDLNHGTADNKPYPFARAEAGNKEFVTTFEELLREVWVGIINASNTSGTKSTDDAKLKELATTLQEMLLARRLNGNLSREEFAAVAMMSWFHLTVESDTAVVLDLRAQATSEAQRLFKIAQLVGVPAHGLAGSYFDIADSVSRILLLIETGIFAVIPNAVAALYTPGSALERLMRAIITHWSIITGRDMKAGKIAPEAAPRRPAAQLALVQREA